MADSRADDLPTLASEDELAAEAERLRAERDALKAELERARSQKSRRGSLRRALVGLLAVLTVLSIVLGTAAVWAHQTLLNTDRWVKTVGPLGADPAVTAALQVQISNQVFAILPAQELIAEALPERSRFLAGPLTNAIKGFVNDQVGNLLASPQFQQAWVEANRVVHTQVVAVLRGDTAVVQTRNGQVVLNLLPVINQALSRLEQLASDLIGKDVNLPTITNGEVPEAARAKLSSALGVQLPADFGEIVVFQSDRLQSAQDAVRLFDRLVVAIVVLALVLLVATFWLSRSRRRTLLQVTIGVMLGLVVLRRLTMRGEQELVDMAKVDVNRGAVQAVTDQVLAGFFSLTRLLILVGLAIVLLALVTGPYRWAVALRRRVVELWRALVEVGGRGREAGRESPALAWIREHVALLQLGGAIVAVLVLLVVDLSWAAFLIVLALLALYELALWRLEPPSGGEPDDPAVDSGPATGLPEH
jgi:CheY-like chemotaxis protein